mgnify:CR=1 FL=1
MNRDKINIGSCAFRKDGWLNLDKPCPHYSSRQNSIDLPHDLMTFDPLGIRDNALTGAYTSHTIEHLSDAHVEHLFKEVHRILEVGGVFRITCPDIGRCHDAYIKNDKEYISNWLLNPRGHEAYRACGLGEQFLFIFASYISPYRKHIIDAGHLGQVKKYCEDEITDIFKNKSREDALDFFTSECQKYAPVLQSRHPGEHISWWDYNKLNDLLKLIGFKNIELQTFNKSNYDVFKNFDECNEDNVKALNYTLFVECRK